MPHSIISTSPSFNNDLYFPLSLPTFAPSSIAWEFSARFWTQKGKITSQFAPKGATNVEL